MSSRPHYVLGYMAICIGRARILLLMYDNHHAIKPCDYVDDGMDGVVRLEVRH